MKEAEDGEELLREFASGADREQNDEPLELLPRPRGTRLVVIDSRAGRVLDEDRRAMVDDAEWDWIAEQATGGFDHLLLASSLPLLLGPGMQELEAWNEAVAGGAWGSALTGPAERMRQAMDLEHWGAFQTFVSQDGRAAALGGGG